MHKLKDHLSKMLATMTLLLTLLSFSEISMANSYLQELENEAAATASHEQADTADKPDWEQQQTGATDNIAPGLIRAHFEEALKSQFYGSYLFYSSLNEEKQRHVYQEYLRHNDIEHLRETIKSQMTN